MGLEKLNIYFLLGHVIMYFSSLLFLAMHFPSIQLFAYIGTIYIS